MAAAAVMPVAVFGCRPRVAGGVCFLEEQVVLHAAGAGCLRLHLEHKWHNFIPGTEKSRGAQALAVSPDKRFLAMSEAAGEQPVLTVYELREERARRRKVLSSDELPARQAVSLAFSPDSRFLAAATASPEGHLAFWVWEKQQLAAVARVEAAGDGSCQVTSAPPPAAETSKPELGWLLCGSLFTLPFTAEWLFGSVQHFAKRQIEGSNCSSSSRCEVSFNPQDNTQVCITGNGFFKLFKYSEGYLKQMNLQRGEPESYLCHAWLSKEEVICGTDTGKLSLFETGDLYWETSLEYRKPPMERGDTKTEESESSDVSCGLASEDNGSQQHSLPQISAVAAYSKGFACSPSPGVVLLFEKTEEKEFHEECQEVWLPQDPFSTEPKKSSRQHITCICFSPSEETMVVSTDKSQLYMFAMFSSKLIREKISYFTYMNFPLHSNSITGLDMCVWKPILATCSLDRSVRVWNYKTNTLELCKEYQEEAYTVSLHPSGLFCLVGFSDKLRFISLLYEDMNVFKEFPVKNCRECSFSNGGHRFAAVNGNMIQIYSSITFENVSNLKGHTGKIHSIKWSADDTKFVSCDTHGAVCEWDLLTSQKKSECVLKTCIYSSISLTYDAKIIFAVGSDQTLKEISGSSIQHEVPAYDVVYTTVAVSRSGRMIFVGTSLGTIRAMKYPLTKKKDFNEYQAHTGAVTKMRVTSDDQFLLTASEDGCVFIWKVHQKEGGVQKGGEELQYAEEVLIMRSDIDEKSQAILDLQICVKDLQTESDYELRLKDMYCDGKIKALEENFTQEIDALKNKHQILQEEKEKQELQHQVQVSELMDKQAKKVQELESDSSQKLSVEIEKYQALQVKSQKIEEAYEKQLHSLEESKSQALKELKEFYEKKLIEKSVLLEKAKEKMEKQIKAHEEMEQQIYEVGDQEILELKDKYERQLFEEKESNIQLKGEIGVLNKRLNSLQKELKDRNRDIEEMRLEQQKLQDIIKSLEKEILALKTDVKEKTDTILEKEKHIYDLKMKNQELQNFKFALSYRIEEFKRHVESRDKDIETMKKQIQDMEEELEQFNKESTELKVNITKLQQKLKATGQEMIREMEKRQDKETLIKRFKADVYRCVGFIQDPKKLKEGICELFTKYVHQSDMVDAQAVDADLQQQYMKQQESHERNLALIRKRVMKDNEIQQAAYMRILQENVSLIKEINDLRQELNVAHTQVNKLQSALKLYKKRKEVQDTAPPSEPEPSPAVLRVNPESESEKIIEMQQLEIYYLRDQIREKWQVLNCPDSASSGQKSS